MDDVQGGVAQATVPPTFLSVRADLERVMALVSRRQVRDALDLLSAIMETVCMHVEPLGLVDPDEAADAESPSAATAAAVLIGALEGDAAGGAAAGAAAATAAWSAAAGARGANGHMAGGGGGIGIGGNGHDAAPPAGGGGGGGGGGDAALDPDARFVPLTVQQRIDFWHQINNTWILAIRSAGSQSEALLAKHEPLTQKAAAPGVAAAAVKASFTGDLDVADVAAMLPPTTADASAPDVLASDYDGASAASVLFKDDWLVLRENIIACGDVLELYGLVDYSMGFAESDIVDAIQDQLIRWQAGL
ncbi:hypothetical protein HK105_205968 [Polyrhizophydium stewartii]|uniref:Uncharacterized protein n=1 Tax=Polyrhizophydium stewartii TaxID=2732419 RepID=A0ABR4N4K2_9FUNG